ncbi:MAG: hypothetical protein CVT49_08750 [candidate division Zixibacteria bacterium HGW-Zixibacteria-1]|nr:MAG: hypothetical protein CVT49_08750 [candidate division Zixibacteria bacterium HGW-Zixibacteria-1]
MNAHARTFICLLIAIFLFAADFSAETYTPPDELQLQFVPRHPAPNYIAKRPGHYSGDDWQAVIDSTWGDGHSVGLESYLFRKFWQEIDSVFPCFNYLDTNVWDSLYDKYYPEILDSVSRGRFSAILTHATMALRESHTRAYDSVVLMTEPAPGVPLLCIGGWGENNHFGAGLTPLPDSSLLVYTAVDNHPLGLVPGDVVLGYDGIPWKLLYPELLDAELPVCRPFWGSSEETFTHAILMAAGLNWHLYDTIDIAKYGTDDTIHLPTSLMDGQLLPLFATEQLPVPGVPFPIYTDAGDTLVTRGLIEETNIGYIYVLGWFGSSGSDFYNAVSEIMFDHETIGLIIDFRTTYGGWVVYQDGLKLLYDTTMETSKWVKRCDPDDHYAMCPNPSFDSAMLIRGDPNSYYNKPIAVLTGPGAVSAGDQGALAMSYHPMVKFFGKPTRGAFNSKRFMLLYDDIGGFVAINESYQVKDSGRYLTHLNFPSVEDFPDVPYEDIWLSRDGAAQGKDDVVEAAMAWINSFDADADGVQNGSDNCPLTFNPLQEEYDGDGIGDSCDNCIIIANPDQADTNSNNIGDICEFTCGDANGDGLVNILDITFLINYLYKNGNAPVPQEAADLNSSGNINILDITYLINYLYKSGPEPSCRGF